MSRIGFGQTEDAGYFSAERSDMLVELPPPYGRALDVGCGAGATGRALRAGGSGHMVGVEPNPSAAALARDVFDRVHEATIEELLASGALEGRFNTILLYDVLEHLVDPAIVLVKLRNLAAPGARVHISVPNARHWTLLRDLSLRGTFGYTEWGHRDATHLRWFTRRDIEALATDLGYRVELSRAGPLGRGSVVDRLSGGLLREFLALQWHVLARA